MYLMAPTDRPRPSRVFALVKLFADREHAEQFLDGDLFMRRLSYFRQEEDAEGRWDSTEGVFAWLQRQGLQIQIIAPRFSHLNINEHDLANPVSISLGEPDDLYIFCTYAYYIEQPLPGDDPRDVYGEDRISELEAALRIDPRCLRFGPHAVVVPYEAFTDRLKKAAKYESWHMRANLVRYYNNDVFNGEFKRKVAPFRKQMRFDYQREFRICIQTLDHSSEPRRFNIGSLRGIAHYIPSETLLNAFKLSLRDNAA
jgi:hypothetical protein